MKKLKRVAAFILALALTVSLGAGVSAASTDSETAKKYISITASSTYKTIGEYTLYYYDYGYLRSRTITDVASRPADVTFTIKNNHPSLNLTVYYMAYKKQPEGTKSHYRDDPDALVDLSGKYYAGDRKYYLSVYADKGATSAGNDLYWNDNNMTAVTIEPGQSIKASLDPSLGSSDTIYQVFAEYYDPSTDKSYYNSYVFFLEETVGGFVDVAKDAYYADAVLWAVEKGVTDGVSKTSFAPSKSVTRAEAVTFLWRAYGKPEPTTTTSKFKDVKDANAYYYKAVLWAAENGITTGVSSTWFDLNSKLTYDEIITFLCRASGGDASGGDWSNKALTWAKNNGVSDNLNFSAKDKCPRSDVVYCLFNQLGK